MLRYKLSPGTKQGFLKSEKMFRFKLLYIHKSVSENAITSARNIICLCHGITTSKNYNFSDINIF